MKIVKELEWVRDYISEIAYMVPNLSKLKKISSMKANKNRWQHFHGLITYTNKKNYRITLYTTYHDMIVDKIKKYSTIDILTFLAHEIAHMSHWDHTTSHKLMENKIAKVFMNKLSRDGYISEEYELKHGLFYKLYGSQD